MSYMEYFKRKDNILCTYNILSMYFKYNEEAVRKMMA